MAESGKSKWFHKLGPKHSSKHQNGIIGPVQHIGFFQGWYPLPTYPPTHWVSLGGWVVKNPLKPTFVKNYDVFFQK
jgi:hypothetical protein